MHKLNLSVIFLMLCIYCLISSCDETPGNVLDEQNQPSVNTLDVSPQRVTFDRSVGIKDTTITLSVSANVAGLKDGELPSYAFFDEANPTDPAFEGFLEDRRICNLTDCTDSYGIELDLEFSTIDFKNYQVFVYALGKTSSNWISTTFEVAGFPNSAPQILAVNNPQEVIIPTDASVIPIPFTAKVTDEDGQNTISEVRILFENEDGSILSPNPNTLFDDGSSESGDLVQGDSVYTITFQIDQSNSPNNRMALYYAIDQAGLSSDTLKLPFNLIRN